MIDLHCHLVYATDDGSRDIDSSIRMLKEARDAGFKQICCTPHYLAPQYIKTKHENQEKLEVMKKRLKEENIDIELFLGNEIYITENTSELIQTGKASTIADTDFVLVEFPLTFKSYISEQEIDSLIANGYNVILAHPERYSYVQKDIGYLDDYIERGVYLQGNYESLLGKYGNNAKKTLIKLIKQQKIDLLSTDNHKENSTYTKMDKILKVLHKYAKDEYFYTLTEGTCKNILKNKN